MWMKYKWTLIIDTLNIIVTFEKYSKIHTCVSFSINVMSKCFLFKLKFNEILKLIDKNKSNGFNSKSLIRRASSSFKHNASFVARLPTIRRHKSQSLHSPGNLKATAGSGSQRGRNCPRTMNEINNSAENLGRLYPLVVKYCNKHADFILMLSIKD
jgi:hypothetical protein